jgi:Zn finger protein HypA/HybF involved in hydrogenase expression
MARFRCHDCNNEGTFSYSGKHECPNCGSRNVQFALSITELADDDPLIIALTELAENDAPETDDET